MPRRTKSPDVRAAETVIVEHVAARIRLRRGLLGLSQSDVARAMGLTFQQVQKFERASNRVSVPQLVRLCDILDVPLSFFFDGLELPGISGQLPADIPAPTLGRRDLDLLRAWRDSPPDVQDTALSLLRLTAGHEAAADDPKPGRRMPLPRPAPQQDDEEEPKPLAARARRKRGAVWDPADVVSPRRRQVEGRVH